MILIVDFALMLCNYSSLALEHVLFVYILKQNKNNSRIFTKNFADFQNF